MRNRLLRTASAAGVLLLLAACGLSDPTQSALEPKGPYAQEVNSLFVPVFWVAVAVFVVVEGGIVWMAIRYRHRKGRERMPAQVHGNTKLEIGWTIAPALVLAGVMIPTVATIWDLARTPPADALNVTVEGYQWWWGFEYTDEDMRRQYGDREQIRVADTLVIPEDRPVYLSVESAGGGVTGDTAEANDYAVIHSFWVPEITSGKQDAVPGRTNHIYMLADEPGTYEGQCAEFCGLQHGRMRVEVVALSAEEWERWVVNQQHAAATPTEELARRGMDLFMEPLSGGRGSCINCHAIGGTDATSEAGPNLTHFADPSHTCFAGCNWRTTDRAALEAWLRDPGAVKFGAKMPDYQLTEDEIDALVGYLYSLE